VNVLTIPQARDIAGKLAGKILNVPGMDWVGTSHVLCPFPCDVLAMYQPSTLALAPSVSSTEAEYMALSDCSCQVVWMHTLLGELGYSLRPIPICGDNQGSIFIASNPVTEKGSKRIDIRYHYICEVIAHKLTELFFINGDENPTDLLTKNLGSIKFLKF